MALLLAGGASANPLEKELASILVDHPQIQGAMKNIEAARHGVDRARAPMFPKLSVAGDTGPEYVDSPGTRQTESGSDVVRTHIVGSVTVTQNLFNGFQTTTQIRTAAINRALTEVTLRGTTQQVLFEAIQAYVDVLKQKRLIEIARETEQTIQQQLELEDERVQRGTGITVDVLQAKSRLQIAKEKRVNYEGALQDAISKYTQSYNHPPPIETMTDPRVPAEFVPSNLEQAIEVAISENPSLLNSGNNIELAREKRSLIAAELYPVVDLVGKTNYEHNKNTVFGTRRDYSLVLQATWELFSGFATRSGQAQTAFEYAAVKDAHRHAVNKVMEQTRIAWQAVLTARERLELLENAVNIASEVFDSRRTLREAGRETVISVLDAENEVNNAQINLTGATYEERVAVFQLLLAMGRLNATYLNIAVE
ncbi:MAG: TolC family protein [Rhodospirillales bacterium]|nr:TolC family protein [Rhodospirillales bacterium]